MSVACQAVIELKRELRYSFRFRKRGIQKRGPDPQLLHGGPLYGGSLRQFRPPGSPQALPADHSLSVLFNSLVALLLNGGMPSRTRLRIREGPDLQSGGPED